MTLPIFPPASGANSLIGKAWPVKWSPQFFNQTLIAQSGAAITIGLAQYPLHNFELSFDVLRDFTSPNVLEWRRLMGFYLSLGGSLGRFLYTNPDDNFVNGQQVGTGDGTTTSFVITRGFGDGGYLPLFNEPVGQVDSFSSTPQVFVNGALQASGYTINTTTPGNNLLVFSVAPAAAAVITMTFNYFYVCRFTDDVVEWQNFAQGRWSLASLKFQSCRPGF